MQNLVMNISITMVLCSIWLQASKKKHVTYVSAQNLKNALTLFLPGQPYATFINLNTKTE